MLIIKKWTDNSARSSLILQKSFLFTQQQVAVVRRGETYTRIPDMYPVGIIIVRL